MSTESQTRFHAEHSIELPTGSVGVFALLADVTRWPVLFGPCVHADVLERGPGTERLRMWAFTGEQVRSWISHRRLDAQALRIGFEQEASPPPFASVGGHWRIEGAGETGEAEGAEGAGRSERLVLAHDWSLLAPDPSTEAWATEALERNSTAEIAAVRRWAQPGADPGELVYGFSEQVAIAATASEVYDFLLRSDLWPQRLPHVSGVDLETDPPSDAVGGAAVQKMWMRTRGEDGTEHSTHSVRLCFPHERIVYKQTAVPAPLLGHAGAWILTPSDDGVRVEARHIVALDPAALADPNGYFGPGATAAQARDMVRTLLARNSLATLEHARRHTETVSP